MKTFLPLVLVFVMFSLSVAGQFAPGDEDYVIYGAAIRTMFAGDKVTFDTQAKIKQIIIRDRTTTDYAWGQSENWQQVKIRLPSLAEDTIADYKAWLKTSTRFKPRFDLALKYTLISQKDYETIFGADPIANSTQER